jgi:hypothetical protein
MASEQNSDIEVIEIGTATLLTHGPAGEREDIVGQQLNMGLADD